MIISLQDKSIQINTVADAQKVIQSFMSATDEISRDKEHLWVLHLNARNAVKVLELVSLGTLSNVLIHPREVFTRAVAVRSASILVVHNHPSGDCEPSNDDITITERLVKAGKLLDINVLDHLIVTDRDYYSFREQGLL